MGKKNRRGKNPEAAAVEAKRQADSKAQFHADLQAATIGFLLGTVTNLPKGVLVRYQRKVGVERIKVSIVQYGWADDSVITVVELPLDWVDDKNPRGERPAGIKLLLDTDFGEAHTSRNIFNETEEFTKFRRFVVVDGWHRTGALLVVPGGELIKVRLRILDGNLLNIHKAALMLNETTECHNKMTFPDFLCGCEVFREPFEDWVKATLGGIDDGTIQWKKRTKPTTGNSSFAQYLVEEEKFPWSKSTVEVYVACARGLAQEAKDWINEHLGSTEEVSSRLSACNLHVLCLFCPTCVILTRASSYFYMVIRVVPLSCGLNLEEI